MSDLQFRINLAVLLDALATLLIVPANKPPVPVLGGVLLDGGEGGLSLAAFDYETSARLHIDPTYVEVKQPGTLLISRVELTRILKAGTKGETKKTWADWDVDVTAGGNPDDRNGATTVVEVGGFDMHLEPLPLDDFPHLPDVGMAHLDATVDRDQLAALLPRIAVAAAAPSSQTPMLRGIRVEPRPGALTLVTTDRFRVAAGDLPAVVAENVGDPLLLPAVELGRIVDRMPAGPIEILASTDRYIVWLRGGDITATVRPVDGEFPRWKQLFPAPDAVTATATVDRDILRKVAVKADALVDTRMRQLLVEVDGDGMRVSPHGKGRGPVVPLVGGLDGAPITLALNPPYLLDALDALTGQVTFQMSTPNRPVLLTDGRGDGYRHLVMPVRLPAGEVKA